MGYLLQTAWPWLVKKPCLICNEDTWYQGVLELKKRTNNRKESGAFLLGQIIKGERHIKTFIFYDDIDPHCFDNGIVEFDGRYLGKIWEICREKDMTIVADVHVHPRGWAQSYSDQHNPIVPQKGHIAFILPNYARDGTPGTFGIFQYLGGFRWKNFSNQSKSIFKLRSN